MSIRPLMNLLPMLGGLALSAGPRGGYEPPGMEFEYSFSPSAFRNKDHNPSEAARLRADRNIRKEQEWLRQRKYKADMKATNFRIKKLAIAAGLRG